MPQGLAYGLGRFVGSQFGALVVAACVIGGAVWLTSSKSEDREKASDLSQRAVDAAAQQQCAAMIQRWRPLFEAAVRDGRFQEAVLLDGIECAAKFGDPATQHAVHQARIQSHLAAAKDSKITAAQRLSAVAELERLAPQIAQEQIPPTLRAKLTAQAQADEVRQQRQRAAALKAEQAAEAARRRREGVSLGMTPDDVLASSWGRPERINRTTNHMGTREQWVYPGRHNYLYFENGVLVSIQN